MHITLGNFEIEFGFLSLYLKIPHLGECYLDHDSCHFDKV